MTTLLDVQGRRVLGFLTNKSGGAVAKGDVVILDSANDESFTTSTAGAEVIAIGIVTEENGIANNAQGRVALTGYVDLVNVNAAVTRGHFGKTHTVAKQAVDAGAARVLGVFCQFLKSGTTPSALLFGQPDGVTGAGGLAGGTPALTLGTSNAAGAASTGIRTDASIALFDATAPVTQAFADAAAAGSAGVAARRDHKHGMPASPAAGLHVVSAQNSANLAVSTSGEGNVTMDTDVTDVQGYHDTGSNTSRFTIPTGEGGGFLLVVNMRLSANPTNGYFTARKNVGSSIVAEFVPDLDTNTSQYVFTGSEFLVLADADYLNFTALAQNACNLQSGFGPWISLIKLY